MNLSRAVPCSHGAPEWHAGNASRCSSECLQPSSFPCLSAGTTAAFVPSRREDGHVSVWLSSTSPPTIIWWHVTPSNYIAPRPRSPFVSGKMHLTMTTLHLHRRECSLRVVKPIWWFLRRNLGCSRWCLARMYRCPDLTKKLK